MVQARRQREEELERNNGVYYHADLLAVPVPESLAAEKGIRRAADKVWLAGEGRAHTWWWWWLLGGGRGSLSMLG